MRVCSVLIPAAYALALIGCAEGLIGEGGADPIAFDDGATGDGGVPSLPTRDGGVAPAPVPGCNPATAPPAPARSLKISEVTINQGVSVRVAVDGTPVTNPSAPIVAGRAGVLRVFVEPLADWQAREVTVRLTLDGDTRETRQAVMGSSEATSLTSTVNFELEPGDISESSAVSVELLEVDPCLDYAGTADDARYPASGAEPLRAKAAPGSFQLVLVPTRYQADGSNRTPNTDAETVARFRETMYAMFPLVDFEVSVREGALGFDRALEAGGDGWTSLLNDCLSLRADDNVDPNTYYYCAVRPSDDVLDYCGRGCVAGIGPVPSPTDPFNRGATGLLYENGVSTFVHEIGHTLGLPHAPCGVSNGDPEFPYNDGGIGVLGYDISTQSLVPADYRDVMSYCSPIWISDYNYDRLYDRLATVTAQRLAVRKGSSIALRPVIIEVDGSLSIGNTIWVDEPPEGETVATTWVDEAGGAHAVPATLVRVTHLPGGIVYVPEMATAPAAIEIMGFGTAVRR